jgi:hypothetical protein
VLKAQLNVLHAPTGNLNLLAKQKEATVTWGSTLDALMRHVLLKVALEEMDGGGGGGERVID